MVGLLSGEIERTFVLPGNQILRAQSRTIVLSLCYVRAMVAITTLPPAADSEARERLLETATRIFYSEGVNTVGVDRIVSEGSVTRATFYRHFPSKQDLVLAYLQKAHDQIEERIDELAADSDDPRALLSAIADDIAVGQILQPYFRG